MSESESESEHERERATKRRKIKDKEASEVEQILKDTDKRDFPKSGYFFFVFTFFHKFYYRIIFFRLSKSNFNFF